MGPLGGAIGGYIGGVIDPTQINGPHIGDGQNQTSADGQPIAWILGTAPCVGNIMDNGPRFEVKKTEGGKGSTTETNTFEAHQTFAILICESCELRDSTIVGIQMVRCNGKIVYDVRPGSTMMAESAKWKQNVTFYFGAEDQLPDPDLEAIHGIGNTPSYRGICYAVFKNFNRSEFGDAIPQFEWVVVSEGAPVVQEEAFVPALMSRFGNQHLPLIDAPGDYEYTANWNNGAGGEVSSPPFDTVQQALAYIGAHQGGPANLPDPSVYVGYVADTGTNAGNQYTGRDTFGNIVKFDRVDAQPDVTDLESLMLLYQFYTPSGYADLPVDAMCAAVAPGAGWVGAANGVICSYVDAIGTLDYYYSACGSGYLRSIYPVCVVVTRKRIGPAVTGTPLPDMDGWFVTPEGDLVSGYEQVTGSFKVLAFAHYTGSDPAITYDWYEQGPVLRDDDPNFDDAAFWTAAYDAAVTAGTLPSGWIYNTDYPQPADSAWRLNTSLPPIQNEGLLLASIVERICTRGGLTDADIDVSELTDLVIGYPIVGQYTAADCIRPLTGCYFFKGTEYDEKIHFHKDGADATVVVDPNDFINGSDEVDEDTRGQEKEYPRLLTGSYIDPTLDFAVGKAKAERRSPDVNAIGEASIQIPVVMAPDDALQSTEKALKIMWSRLQGKRKFSLPYASGERNYLQMVPAMPFGLEGKRYVVDQLTIEDGQLAIECSYDRQSAYRSDVTAVPTLPPTRPPSTIYGPTMFAAMNLPALRPQDNVPGMYLAACGLLSNWPGCVVQISFDGGANYTKDVVITTPSVMGVLTDDVAAEGSNAEPVLVSIYGGELTSATEAQLATGANAFALLDGDNRAEVAQFKLQDETSPKRYALTQVTRNLLGSVAQDHLDGDPFIMLANVVFVPIDLAYAGTMITFRPVTYGTDPALSRRYDLLFDPGELVEDGGTPG